MADELDALLERVDDAGLRSELRSHIQRLRRRRQFVLVFESHLPERVRLPDHPIRRGSKSEPTYVRLAHGSATSGTPLRGAGSPVAIRLPPSSSTIQ